jgi:hypothetical protein
MTYPSCGTWSVCPNNTFSPTAGSTACSLCQAGYATAGPGQSSAVACLRTWVLGRSAFRARSHARRGMGARYSVSQGLVHQWHWRRLHLYVQVCRRVWSRLTVVLILLLLMGHAVCPPNTYSLVAGAATCTPCPAGTAVAAAGSSTLSACQGQERSPSAYCARRPCSRQWRRTPEQRVRPALSPQGTATHATVRAVQTIGALMSIPSYYTHAGAVGRHL